MIPVRAFNEAGIEAFKNWLATSIPGGSAEALLADSSLSEAFHGRSINPAMKFGSRYEFGCYLQRVFDGIGTDAMLDTSSDGMWAWVNALYFPQLAPIAIRRFEHYIPTRRGSAGSLIHRNAARTAFELVVIHGEHARFVLQQKMHTHGQLLESLSASQSIVRNHGFFAAAAKLYVLPDGKLKRGATSKPKRPKDRKPGEETGKGSIRRLPTALKRLDLTYDVEVLMPEELVSLLPREYARWNREPVVASRGTFPGDQPAR
jgi:hypothetical protein